MPNPQFPKDEADRFIDCIEQKVREGLTPRGKVAAVGQLSALKAAAVEMGYNPDDAHKKLTIAQRVTGREPDWTLTGPRKQPVKNVVLPEFPEDDIPVEDIIETMTRRYEKRITYQATKRWFEIKVKDPLPMCLAIVGDPHVDDNGCNWPLLRSHIEAMKKPGVRACNIGDTTNNWSGRLVHLWGEQDTSKKTAWKLAKWFLTEAGIPWIVQILGNHDVWQDGAHISRLMNCPIVPMEDWQAKFKLVFPNERECRIWAAHNFPGNSQWNSLHGPQKAAHMKEQAHIYAAGHTHNWALHQEESASREFTYWLARARGYKFIDSYAEQLGHFSQDEGATIAAVINPNAKTEAAFVQCFSDFETGVDYTQWLRSRS